MRSLSSAIAILLVSLLPDSSTGEPLRFDFTGAVIPELTGGVFGGQGNELTGFYIYDSTLLDSNPSSTQDIFNAAEPANQTSIFEVSVTVGSATRTTADNQNLPGTNHHFVEFLDGSGEDRFQMRTGVFTTGDDFVSLLLRDFLPVGAPDGIRPGNNGLTGTPPTSPPDPALFSVDTSFQNFYEASTSDHFEGRVAFVITGITAQPRNEPPVCSSAVADGDDLWPPDHKFADVSVLGVTDPDGDPVSITITGISQDEPLEGLGDGNTCPDASGIGSDTASVRAERSGRGDGRVYQVRFHAADDQGGACSGTIAVCVAHDRGRRSECVESEPNYDSTACGE